MKPKIVYQRGIVNPNVARIPKTKENIPSTPTPKVKNMTLIERIRAKAGVGAVLLALMVGFGEANASSRVTVYQAQHQAQHQTLVIVRPEVKKKARTSHPVPVRFYYKPASKVTYNRYYRKPAYVAPVMITNPFIK
jgi:hypothetical protein